MTRTEGNSALSTLKITILKYLNDYRACTTEQLIQATSTYTTSYLQKVLTQLRKAKLIKSKTLVGSRQQVKGFSYHQITTAGLELIALHEGRENVGTSDYYLPTALLHQVLLANDILIKLRSHNWSVLDSRKAKEFYSIDRRTQLQGMIQSEVGEPYGIYVMNERVLAKTVGKIQSEMMENRMKVRRYMIFAKGGASYQHFLNKALQTERIDKNGRVTSVTPLYTGQPLKIFPMKLGVSWLLKYPSEWLWYNALIDTFEMTLESTEQEHPHFNVPVTYNGQPYFLVSFVDTDLLTLRYIETYNDSEFNRYKRKLLVVTVLTAQTDLLKGLHDKVEPLQLSGQQMKQLIQGEAE